MRDEETFSQGAQKLREGFYTQHISCQTKKGVLCLEYGFIRGEDGNTYFIHASNLYGERIDRGYYVHFKTFVTDRSDYNAKNVNVVEVPESGRSKRKKKKV